MDLFGFIVWAVVLTCCVALAWPLNVPLMALAYRVRRGTEAVDFETGEFWTRSVLAALGPAVLAVILAALAYLLVAAAGLPPGPVLLVLFMAFLPAAVSLVMWCYGFDEMVDGLGLFLIYVLLPGLPLLAVGWLAGLWPRLAAALPWLFPG